MMPLSTATDKPYLCPIYHNGPIYERPKKNSILLTLSPVFQQSFFSYSESETRCIKITGLSPFHFTFFAVKVRVKATCFLFLVPFFPRI